MTTAVMSAGMNKVVQSTVMRQLRETTDSWMRVIPKVQAQPMATLNNSLTFDVNTPLDGQRQFILTITLSEVSTPITGNSGRSISTKD